MHSVTSLTEQVAKRLHYASVLNLTLQHHNMFFCCKTSAVMQWRPVSIRIQTPRVYVHRVIFKTFRFSVIMPRWKVRCRSELLVV